MIWIRISRRFASSGALNPSFLLHAYSWLGQLPEQQLVCVNGRSIYSTRPYELELSPGVNSGLVVVIAFLHFFLFLMFVHHLFLSSDASPPPPYPPSQSQLPKHLLVCVYRRSI